VGFKKKLFKNMFSLALYNYGSQGIYFLSTIVLSRLLLPSEYGFVTLITVFINFISIFSDAGISHAIIRSDYGKTYQKALGTLTNWIGIGLFLLMVLLAYPIAWFYDNFELVPATIVLATLFIFRAIAIVPTSILNKQLKFSILGKYSLWISVLNTIITIVLAYLKFSYWAIILPQVLTAVIHYLLLEREVKIGLKFYPRNYIKVAYVKTKSLIGNVTGFNMINYWAGNSDALLIGKLYGEASLGLYNRAYSLMAIALNLIGGLFNLVLYPSFKEHQSTGGDIRKEYEDILGLISLMNFPIGFILIVFPVQLVSVLWGSNWISVSEFLPYFGLLIMCKTMLASTTNVYILLGEEKLNMIIGSISAVTMIVAIVAGAFISLRYVAFMHALAYIAFVLPVNVYWGFYKAIGYPFKFIIRFWLPKVLFFLCLLFSIHENQKTLSVIFLLAYFLHILFLQRKNIKRLFVSGRPVFS
jgi:O-antigen/teichoic acid export membrane protein